jgi:hypothetical protein
MSQATPPFVLFRSKGLVWVQDADTTIVIDKEKDQVHILQGQERMIWSWLTLGYDFRKLTGLYASALNISSAAAESRLVALINEWAQKGMLVREEVVYG